MHVMQGQWPPLSSLRCRGQDRPARRQRKTPEAKLRGSSIFVSENTWNDLHHPFALRFLPSQLAGTPNRFGFLARFFLGRLLEMLLELHFAEYAFTLQFFLQGTKRLIDIVVANTNLHVVFTTFLS
jgi:hypothetical protein